MTDQGLERYLVPELLTQLGDAVTVIGPDWRYRYVSESAAEIIGRPQDECVGAAVWELFPEVVGTPAYEACVRAMEQRTRETVVWFFDTVGRWYEQHALPVADGLVICVQDVTDRFAEVRRAEQLAAVGEAIAQATSVEQVNTALALHVHPLVDAAGGTILLADEDRGVMHALGWAGMDDEVGTRWTDFPLDAGTPSTVAHRTGSTVLVEGLDDARARFPRVAVDLERHGHDAVVALPLTSAGARLGAWSLVLRSGRRLSRDEQRFLATAAAMVAQALLRAGLLDAERRAMSELQERLLPATLPSVEGLDVAVRYAAGDAAVEVGGDWYDVVPLPGGSVGLVMGDVEGHDVQAAACMGLVRSAVRAYAAEGHPPAVVIDLADRFVVETGIDRLVTVAYAHVHPHERLVLTVSAGHLPLVAVSPDGVVREVPTDLGPPLGVLARAERGSHDPWPETTSSLSVHGLLAAYTDGLVETREADLDVGLARVRGVLVDRRTRPVDEVADALLAVRSPSSRDDVALLVARLTSDAPTARRSTRRLPPAAVSVTLARRSTRQLLEEWRVDCEVRERVELVVSELVTNAARNADEALELVVAVAGAVLRVEVSDSNHRLPVAPLDELDPEATSGRGLLLVEAVSDRWGVEPEGLGKRVWAELDLAADTVRA